MTSSTPSSGSGGRRSGPRGSGKGRSGTGRGGGTGGGKRGGGAASGGGKGGGRKGETAARGRPPTEEDPAARLRKPLERVLARLPVTQREVLEWRMGLKDGHPHDLADTARQLGLSLSEARDIEQRAFAHIREAIPLEQLAKFLED